MSPEDPRGLRDLLGDAVADVEPRDRLGEIRRRTARPAHHRRWPLIVLGTATATVAVVAAVAVLGGLGAGGEDGGPASRPVKQPDAVAVYYLREDWEQTRLYREFQPARRIGDEAERTLEALRRLESDAGPQDPDYRTAWPDGAFLTVDAQAAQVTVELSEEAAGDLSSASAESLQQVVYTAQAAAQRIVPVSFARDGRVLVDRLTRDASVLSALNISDPVEGHVVDDLLTVRGTVRPQPETVSVGWSLRSEDGKIVLSRRTPIIDGTWEETAGISALPPGTYVVDARIPVGVDTPAVDTRTIVVR